MSAKKPTRVFTAIEENPSLGDNGPTGLKADIDTINKMFDPDATHDTGEPGGIQVGNIAHDSIGNTGGAGDANKIVQFKSDGSLPGNIDMANNAVDAANVTTNINNKAISSIFESNGTTVKEATHAESASLAEAAKGDTRFQVSGHLHSNVSIAPSANLKVQSFWVSLPVGKTFVLKNARINFEDMANCVLRVISNAGSWQSPATSGEYLEINQDIAATLSGAKVSIFIDNTSASTSETNGCGSGWWLDFAIE
jgi:hypothetical protein